MKKITKIVRGKQRIEHAVNDGITEARQRKRRKKRGAEDTTKKHKRRKEELAAAREDTTESMVNAAANRTESGRNLM